MKEYVFITGGELFNKGAQSMTFITVDKMKKRFPSAEIIVLSTSDFERPEEEKELYDFTILPFSIGWVYDLAGGPLKVFWRIKNLIKKSNITKHQEYKKVLDKMLDNTVAWVDVSGYALSSQFRNERSIGFLLTILLAKSRNVKMVIMPQSFGPFNYNGKTGHIISLLMKRALPYPIKIYAREDEGYENLKDFGVVKNIERSYDMVLLTKNINYENIYKNVPSVSEFLDYSGVGIVPNKENFNHGNREEVLKTYQTIIDKILKTNKNVYIIRHSHNDADTCKAVKELFLNNGKVILMNEDISSREFDNLVKRLDFIVGSRFHSIVHSYKNNVPCIAIGWATKYHELLKLFNQDDYIFDVRQDFKDSNLDEAVDQLLNNFKKESEVIKKKLTQIQTENKLFSVFDQH